MDQGGCHKVVMVWSGEQRGVCGRKPPGQTCHRMQRNLAAVLIFCSLTIRSKHSSQTLHDTRHQLPRARVAQDRAVLQRQLLLARPVGEGRLRLGVRSGGESRRRCETPWEPTPHQHVHQNDVSAGVHRGGSLCTPGLKGRLARNWYAQIASLS